MRKLYLIMMALLLVGCVAPVWAAENPDQDFIEFTVTFYSKGVPVLQCGTMAMPGSACYIVASGGPPGAMVEGAWVGWSYGDAQPNERTATEFAKYSDRSQHVTCRGVEFMLCPSLEADWIELELRACPAHEYKACRPVMGMSPELDEGIFNKLFDPAGHAAFATKRFPHMLAPEELVVE